MSAVSFTDPAALDRARFGGKAAELARATQAGLPVPPGYALSRDLVNLLALASPASTAAERELLRLLPLLGGPVAVRSSAPDEDGAGSSFAGQHQSFLHVLGAHDVLLAIRTIAESATEAAGYRARLGLEAGIDMAVVIQSMVAPRCAGVMFTRDPMTHADVRVIEAAWGLGEGVVQGMVDPDRVRLARGGEVLSYAVGDKDVEVLASHEGGTGPCNVDAQRRGAAVLSPDELHQLEALAVRCEELTPGPHDIEWAIAGGALHLLQCRRITR